MGVKDLVEQIAENYTRVRNQIADAARRSGRSPEAVKLVVVSKAQSLTVVEAAVRAGIRTFGENYPEEAVEKIRCMQGTEGIEWHMIGHLQSRKARLVAESFHFFHSLDSLRLASKLNDALALQNKDLPVLLEMNVSGEQSKYGWAAWDETRWGDLLVDVEQIAAFSRLKLKGLMAMPPLFSDPRDARPFFRKLKKLSGYLSSKLPSIPFTDLSMGTSADFAVAVEEGATFVRIGQAILGPRPVG